MKITKALIIDEPWITKILNGEKCWEMRSTKASHRGPFGLIRKGSGQIVGIANLVDVSGPYENSELETELIKHHVTRDIYLDPEYKWRYAWHLSNVRKLNSPVNYKHKSGAVTWVTLDDEVTTALSNQSEPPVSKNESKVSTSELCLNNPKDSLAKSTDIKQHLDIVLTQGNINNNHFYIPQNTTIFPKNAWGGKNKHVKGEDITVHFGRVDKGVKTEIDGSKRILRCRGKIGDFFKLYNLSANDVVQIKKLKEREFLILKK